MRLGEPLLRERHHRSNTAPISRHSHSWSCLASDSITHLCSFARLLVLRKQPKVLVALFWASYAKRRQPRVRLRTNAFCDKTDHFQEMHSPKSLAKCEPTSNMTENRTRMRGLGQAAVLGLEPQRRGCRCCLGAALLDFGGLSSGTPRNTITVEVRYLVS